MGFLDNFFMADAISRADDLDKATRDAIMFSSDVDDDDCNDISSDCFRDVDPSDETEIDPFAIARQLASLKSAARSRERLCERIRKTARKKPLDSFDLAILETQKIHLREIERLSNLLKRFQNYPNEK